MQDDEIVTGSDVLATGEAGAVAEGVRLLAAFHLIPDARVRASVLDLIERIARSDEAGRTQPLPGASDPD